MPVIKCDVEVSFEFKGFKTVESKQSNPEALSFRVAFGFYAGYLNWLISDHSLQIAKLRHSNSLIDSKQK